MTNDDIVQIVITKQCRFDTGDPEYKITTHTRTNVRSVSFTPDLHLAEEWISVLMIGLDPINEPPISSVQS